MPRLLPLYEKYHDRGLNIIEIRLDMDATLGIKSKADLDERIASVAKPTWKGHGFPSRLPWSHPATTSEESKGTGVAVIEGYGANVPSAVLIDRQGRVVGRFDPNPDRDQSDNAVFGESAPGETALISVAGTTTWTAGLIAMGVCWS